MNNVDTQTKVVYATRSTHLSEKLPPRKALELRDKNL